MENGVNLVVRLKCVDDPRWKAHGVTRLRLDGHGRMILWDAETGETTTIELASVEALVIESVPRARKAA